MSAAAHAIGKFAFAICDRCGEKIRYLTLRSEAITNLRVCEDCEDEPHPYQTGQYLVRVDAIALREPRPDNDDEISESAVEVGSSVNAIAFEDGTDITYEDGTAVEFEGAV